MTLPTNQSHNVPVKVFLPMSESESDKSLQHGLNEYYWGLDFYSLTAQIQEIDLYTGKTIMRIILVWREGHCLPILFIIVVLFAWDITCTAIVKQLLFQQVE